MEDSDAKRAETFAGLTALMADTKAEKRAVLGVMAQLRNDGFLLKVEAHAPGRPAKYRLTFPTAKPVEIEKVPAPPKTWEQWIAYFVAWLNCERDVAAVKARWESATEHNLHSILARPICSNCVKRVGATVAPGQMPNV